MADRPIKMLTIVEVSDYLDKPVSWVYANWRPQGMPFRKVGNQLRCRPSDLERWFDQQAA
ncbi:hypothetical protein GCM10023205_03820 [Yinghuangia aomiensis]|uniref:Helix-turn-helix domain-containing protein n=1 Tax=Yinghuangia aomiensis TaxID=676205 RepID=A0ABP9GL89_9ACTN